GPRDVAALPGCLPRVTGHAASIIRLVELSMLYDLSIAHATWQAVRAAAPSLSRDADSATKAAFLALFTHPDGLAAALRRLHEVGVLEIVIPQFEHARHLLQFNNYHKYTVDEHSIVAVEKAAALATDDGWLGTVWGQIRRKRTLLLAILIHDLGKGFEEDHSEVGARIARDTAAILGLPEDEAAILEFLVHKHLLMAHLAFRRDVDDTSLVVRFASDVGSPEVLRMLTVLTAADVSAVGPGTWNRWKADLLGDLYFKTLGHLDGESPSIPAERTRQAIERMLEGRDPADPAVSLARSLPLACLRDRDPATILGHAAALARLPPDGVLVDARWQEETSTLAIMVGTRETVASGIFHRITGGLTSQRLEILAADIHTLVNGLVIDHFVVRDPDYGGEPPSDRVADVKQAIRASLKADDPPVFARCWNPFAPQIAAASRLPTRVLFDNESSERSTILEVFTHDSPGLLYGIARTLFDAGLCVQSAKIGTFSDQVVDAFHVTDGDGRKVTGPQRLDRLRRALERVAAPPWP
ncbi:MAG: HD domain-containing protein, partial [Planctomycetia bacterium]